MTPFLRSYIFGLPQMFNNFHVISEIIRRVCAYIIAAVATHTQTYYDTGTFDHFRLPLQDDTRRECTTRTTSVKTKSLRRINVTETRKI